MKHVCVSLIVLCVATIPVFGQEIPGTDRDKRFDAIVRTLDLDKPGYEFTYKGGKRGGSSVGFHIAEAGHGKRATFLPTNTSSNPEAEVLTYRLARFLGVGRVFNPVAYYDLGPGAAARFKAMLLEHREGDPDRALNRANVLAQVNRKPGTLFGIYRYRAKGNRYRVDSLCVITGQEGRLRTSHPFSAFIRAAGPMPTERLMSFSGVKGARADYPQPREKEIELARQLSSILVIDQLTGQWDRCTGNLEAVGDATGRLQFLARDNGGAEVDDGWEFHAMHDQWVSRYDHEVHDRLIALNAFLKGKAAKFGNFDAIEPWKVAVGFRKAGSFRTFRAKLARLVEKRFPALERQYGSKMFFLSAAPVAQGMTTPASDQAAQGRN